MMRKKMAVLLAAAMTAGLVSGCGKTGNSGQDAVVEDTYHYTGEAPITDKENQKVSILAQNSWYSTVDIKEAPIVKKVYEDAGISIDWTLVDPTNYKDAVSPMLAAGTDLPDIVMLQDKDDNMTYINSGIFIPLDEYFDYMPNYVKWLDENPSIRASMTAPDGHIYYVPGTNVPYNYQPALMYNMKWVKEAGFDKSPETLDEFTEMLRYFKEHDMNGNGNASDEIPMSVMKEFVTYMFGPAFGLNFGENALSSFFADENGQAHYAFYEKEKYKEFLTYLHGLYEEGLLELEYTTLTRDQIIERFAQDKTGVTFDYGYQMSMVYSPQLSYYDGTAETGVCAVAPLSGPEKGFYPARNPIGNVFGVNKNSSDILMAVKFLDYSMAESNQEMYAWGIEGESYEVVDGKKQYTEQGKDSNWLQAFGINPSIVYPARQSVEATDVLVADWHAAVDKTLEQYMDDPWPFIYSNTDESSLMSQYMVDIQTYAEEMMVSFISGVTPLDQFDSYISTLQSMNMDEVLKVKTEQYGRYQKALEQ